MQVKGSSVQLFGFKDLLIGAIHGKMAEDTVEAKLNLLRFYHTKSELSNSFVELRPH